LYGFIRADQLDELEILIHTQLGIEP